MLIERDMAPPPPRIRGAGGLAMVARCITALLGGYASAAALATLLARLLPGDRAEATAWGMIASFLLYAAIGLWCFHEARLVLVTDVRPAATARRPRASPRPRRSPSAR